MNSQDEKAQNKERYPDSPNSNSIQEGLEFQDFAMDKLAEQLGLVIQVYSSRKWQFEKGESRQRFEFKRDNLCTETERLSIEIAEKTGIDAPWIKSGIYGNSIFYVQGNFDRFWVFFTKFLRKLHKCPDSEGNRKYEEKEEPTIRAFYLPLEDADKYGIKIEAKAR